MYTVIFLILGYTHFYVSMYSNINMHIAYYNINMTNFF